MSKAHDETLWFVVSAELAGERIDKAVVALLAEEGRSVTRAEVQRWIEAGEVRVDGRPVRRSQPVHAGTRLAVRPLPEPTTDLVPDPTVPFRVVYEDEHLVVVDKPAGIVVHPARGNWTGTLVAGLLARQQMDRELADPRDDRGHLRPGIVHRLDKGTSGLLVVARTARAREALKQAFSCHDVLRRYTAIVVGHARAASYDTPYGRSPTNRLKFTSRTVAQAAASRRAVTHVEPIEQCSGTTLVQCRLETGRTHQIRVHLSEQSGTPVLGDPLYGGRPRDRWLAELAAGLGRQALHAGLLGFQHPATGERVSWESPLPADMQHALTALRERAASAARGRGAAS